MSDTKTQDKQPPVQTFRTTRYVWKLNGMMLKWSSGARSFDLVETNTRTLEQDTTHTLEVESVATIQELLSTLVQHLPESVLD
jgi:hypothetical protein